jgi:hypothetical protein
VSGLGINLHSEVQQLLNQSSCFWQFCSNLQPSCLEQNLQVGNQILLRHMITAVISGYAIPPGYGDSNWPQAASLEHIHYWGTNASAVNHQDGLVA